MNKKKILFIGVILCVFLDIFVLGLLVCGETKKVECRYNNTEYCRIPGEEGLYLELIHSNGVMCMYPAINATILEPGDIVILKFRYDLKNMNGVLMSIEKRDSNK